MNEAWLKHIQPIINSPGFDHSNWIWDPFLEKYPKFKPAQRIQVEDVLISCSFDSNDDELIVKALGIAGILYDSKLASKRFSKKMKDGLRKRAQTIQLEQIALLYYVFAFSTFGLKEAAPNIKSLLYLLKGGLPDNPIYLNERSHRELFRACCISLLKLGDSEAKSLFAIFIEYDLRMSVISPDRALWGLTDIASFWHYIGVSGFQKIVATLQVWRKEYLVSVLPKLKQKTEHIHYRSGREKQKVMKLVEQLENSVVET